MKNVPPKKPILEGIETVQGIANKRGIGNAFANLASLGSQPTPVETPIAPPPNPQAAKEIVQQVRAEKPALPVRQAVDSGLPLSARNGPPEIPEGPPPGYQYDPDEFNPVEAATRVVQQVQTRQDPVAAAVMNASPGVDVPAAAQIVQSIQSQHSPGRGQVVEPSRSPDDWVLDEISPALTNRPNLNWVLDEDLPPIQAATQVVQRMQGSTPTEGGSKDNGFDRSNDSYNAGSGGGGGHIPPGIAPANFDRPTGARVAGTPPRPPIEGGLWKHLAEGFLRQAGDGAYSDSVIGDTFRSRKFPEIENSGLANKAAFQIGRGIADVQGYGTRKGFWNMNPEDAIGTTFREIASNQGLSAPQQQLSRYAAATTLGLVGGNYNPLNIAEGGRTDGFSAVNPTDEDPRKSENPIAEFVFDRAMLGRTGRVLPWEQFHEERPEVPYETYSAYQDYLRAPSFLGLVKGTMDGIDGPEVRVVGSRVQPAALLAALAAGSAVVGGFKHYNNSKKV